MAAAKTLGDALRRVSYNEESIEDLLGDDAWTTALDDVPVHERRLPQSPLATAIRLFFLELPVKRAAAEHALGTAGVGALERTGLAQVGKHVSPQARIAPVENLLVASDRLSTNPTDDPPDYVSTYSPTARLCDLLTPRPDVQRALDVGTGNGVQALLVAGHSEHVRDRRESARPPSPSSTPRSAGSTTSSAGAEASSSPSTASSSA